MVLYGILIADDSGKVIYAKQNNEEMQETGMTHHDWALNGNKSIYKLIKNQSFNPPEEGRFRAITFRDKVLVYLVFESIFYMAVGDDDIGELVKEVTKRMYGICDHILKKTIDSESLLKFYSKLTIHFDDLMDEDGYGCGSLILDEKKIQKKLQ